MTVAAPTALVLGADEICVAARLAGRTPLPVFATGWAPDEAAVADAVALRTLLARGLVTVEHPTEDPTLVLATDSLLPLLRPEAAVEVVSEGPGGDRRRWLVGEVGGRLLLAEERHMSVWHLSPGVGTAERHARFLLDGLLAGTTPTGATTGDPDSDPTTPVRVPARIWARAVNRRSTGGGDTLDPWLRAQGLPGADARRLALLLNAEPTTVTVRTARHRGGELSEAGSVSWLTTDRAGIWLLDPAAGPDDDGHHLLRPATPIMVRAAVADLLGLADDPLNRDDDLLGLADDPIDRIDEPSDPDAGLSGPGEDVEESRWAR